MNAAPSRPATDEVHLVRTINASRDKVFAAWTSQQTLEQWFAPHGCTIEFRAYDATLGGRYLSCIKSPEGHECWCCGTYEVFSPPEKLVMTMSVCDRDGRLISPVAAGMDPDWPATTSVAIDFEDLGGSTRITLHQTVAESLARRTGAYPSWLQMFDRLAERLAA